MSKEIFLCADHHFNHKKIILNKEEKVNGWSRNFESIEEMNELLINNHNSVVKPRDIVYMLGDVCSDEDSFKFIKRMNGYKILVMGNNDKQQIKNYIRSFKDCKGVVELGEIVLTHIPVHPSQLLHKWNFNIHGHLHSYLINDSRYLNVSVEQIKFTPINLDKAMLKLMAHYRTTGEI